MKPELPPRRVATLVASLSLLALVTGCAAYSPQPLSDRPEILSPPVAAVLNSDAVSLKRDYLQPVTLDLSQPLDGNAIATIAVIANPDLKGQRARAGVGDAQAFDAGLLPDPTFSMGADKVLSGPDTMVNLTAALGLDLNALRTRNIARAQADAAARQVRLDLAWAEWQTAGQARIQAVRIQGLSQKLALDEAGRAAQQSLLERTQRAAGRSDVPASDLQSARMGALDAATQADDTARSLAAARFELTRLLGLAPETELTLADQPLPEAPPSAEFLFGIATRSRADLAALRAGYDAQEGAVHKAVMDQFPALNLTINANRDSADNMLVGPALDFTLPLWNRNRGGIAIETATRDALKAEYDARLFQTRAEIAAAVADLALARGRYTQLAAEMPAAQRYADATARAASAGRGDLSPATAEAAAQTLRDKQSLMVAAAQDTAELTIALELLTGQPREMWTK